MSNDKFMVINLKLSESNMDFLIAGIIYIYHVTRVTYIEQGVIFMYVYASFILVTRVMCI